MKLISEKYRKLRPIIECLGDEIIIAQAWKKTHAYMRAHNWYADTLALDISALGLELNAMNWAKSIKSSNEKVRELELVPASKSEAWIVDEKGWKPKKERKKSDSPPIRPLAHLTIRDQTWATALMLCLADGIETAQGDCSERNFQIAKQKGVFSYGNRLLCDWKDKHAWFRWGNGETYRKFFTDYQNFLKRPIELGRMLAEGDIDSDHVFIVNLDLSKFYDNIDRNILISRLKKYSTNKDEASNTCEEFWRAAEKITNWQWGDAALEVAKRLNLSLGKGLPQGLVAAGFFANAYMIDFDKAIGENIGKNLPRNPGVIVHDYCRYVDDLRLVVSVEDFEIEKLASAINNWVARFLVKYAGTSLKLNESKTKITVLSDLDNTGSLAGRIAQLQGDLSGPADRDILDNAIGILEGLLTIRSENLPEITSDTADRELVRLAKFDNDIRADTLKRFAANRLESIMRNKRKLDPFTVSAKNLKENPLDNESELLAKKLVWAWMQDPSLALVLRKAIEIFPSPIIVEPVFQAVFDRSSFGARGDDYITAAMMDYLMADLFRCCVDFYGFFQRIEYPISADPDSVLDIAACFAQKAISSESIPVFVERQALLLLAVLQKPVFLDDPEKTIQHRLHSILVSRPPKYQRQQLALFEVAAQITGRPDPIAALLLENIQNLSDDEKYGLMEDFAKRGGEFWLSIWKQIKKKQVKKSFVDRLKWAAPVIASAPKPVRQKLSKIIISDKNGFEQEAAVIKLALGLLQIKDIDTQLPLSPKEIFVSKQEVVVEWDQIWKPEVKEIKCKISKSPFFDDPRYETPNWISQENSDNKIIFWVGSILRAAIVGSGDFTNSRWKYGKIISYKGLKTGWYKRRMGMMHAPEALTGEYATVSSWIAELLMKCLQWPGFESSYLLNEEIKNIEDIETLIKTLKDRLKIVNELYCNTLEVPALITSIRRPQNNKRKGFRLVTVQQLLPRSDDFSISDPKLDLPRAKAKNRDHLSRICQLTYKTLLTKNIAEEDEEKSCADLIIFPEVAIHSDDQDIVKRLADKTGSIVFAGLVFQDYKEKLVNIARWYIPDYRDTGRQWIIRDQGKANMTGVEKKLGASGYRPCQHIVEINGDKEGPFKISGAICFDATDLKLAVDLANKTDLFVICAHNKDVRTFDTMASALHYHMYQHVAIINKGEFGGSTIQAPYKEPFDRLISHVHGTGQISINIADIDLAAFRRGKKHYKPTKTKPAGIIRIN